MIERARTEARDRLIDRARDTAVGKARGQVREDGAVNEADTTARGAEPIELLFDRGASRREGAADQAGLRVAHSTALQVGFDADGPPPKLPVVANLTATEDAVRLAVEVLAEQRCPGAVERACIAADAIADIDAGVPAGPVVARDGRRS